jgi:hypothetical protein
MPLSLREMIYGGAAPATVAVVLFWAGSRYARRDVVRTFTAPLALAAGFLAGYALLALGPLVPRTHWHYLPHVVLAAAVIAPAIGRPRSVAVRMILMAVATVVATWLLVPTSGNLPARALLTAEWAAIAVLSSAVLDFALRRINAAVALLLLSAVLTCGAVVLGLAGSLRFAQMAGCGAAALGGMAAASWIVRAARPLVSGVALPAALLVTGAMLIGRTNSFSDVPLVSYLLIPLATAALWLAATPSAVAARGWRRGARLVVPVVVATAGAILALAMEGAGGEEW